VRGDSVAGLAVKVIGPLGVGLPHPASTAHRERPCASGTRINRLVANTVPVRCSQTTRRGQRIGRLKAVGAVVGISICRVQRPAAAVRRKRACVRRNFIRRLAVKLVGAVRLDFPQPASAVHRDCPCSHRIFVHPAPLPNQRSGDQRHDQEQGAQGNNFAMRLEHRTDLVVSWLYGCCRDNQAQLIPFKLAGRLGSIIRALLIMNWRVRAAHSSSPPLATAAVRRYSADQR